jgi:hypothetical protein
MRPDWIVLCGDILPDFPRIQGQQSRLEAQREFWATYRHTFIRDSARTTLVRGNHELEGFADPELCRLPDGLDGQVVRLEGVPAEFGWWGWSREWDDDQLEHELLDQLRDAPRPRIYLSHVPPYGCLDMSAGGQHIGHRPLADHLEERGWPNSLVLCGHVHADFGCMGRGKTLIVNAACGYALIDWNPKGAEVLNLARMQASSRR